MNAPIEEVDGPANASKVARIIYPLTIFMVGVSQLYLEKFLSGWFLAASGILSGMAMRRSMPKHVGMFLIIAGSITAVIGAVLIAFEQASLL